MAATTPENTTKRARLVRIAARFVYAALSVLALPFALWHLAKRSINAGEGEVVRWREYFGFCPRPPADDGRVLIWLHAVSVGEAAAAMLLARELQKHCRLMLTHTTAAGGAFWRRHFDDAGVVVSACPLDIPFAARLFFRRCRPALGVIMEAEYWPHLTTSARAAGCKLVLANARLNKTSARKYARIKPLMQECAESFDAVCAQHRHDARRLRFFGAANVCITGNMKFDREVDGQAAQNGKQWRQQNPSSPVLLIAGSRPAEEEIILSAITTSGAHDKLKIVWAPRHPQRAAVLATMLNRRGITFARRGNGDDIGKSAFYIADTLGEMDAFYAFCDAALIGGSFAPYGGQNPIEAMQHNIAAVIGPHTENYLQLVRDAVKAGALIQAQNANDAIQTCITLATDPSRRQQIAAAAKTYHAKNRGAMPKTRQIITALLG